MDGELHTPDPDCFLDGITRRSVMSLARRQQMKVVERPIEFSEMARATEVFLAGTAAEVTPVREIAGHRYTPARITETLLRGYDALVRQSPAEVASGVTWSENAAAGDVRQYHSIWREEQRDPLFSREIGDCGCDASVMSLIRCRPRQAALAPSLEAPPAR